MKTALIQLKSFVAECSKVCQETRVKIQNLSWKEGTLSSVREVLSKRNASGFRVNGHKSVKCFRRPETGTQRSNLWAGKRDRGFEVRHGLLALAYARGRAYTTVERRCRAGNEASAYTIFTYLTNMAPELGATRDQVQAWLKGETATQQVAA